MTTSLKTCFKCKCEKPLTDFYKHRQMGDGHLNKCKECTKKDVLERYINKLDQVSEYEKNRFKTLHRKNKVLEYQRNRRAKHPDKYKARQAVSHALRDRKIVKQPCRDCGSIKSQAHHDDYSKPLNVEWLCFSCHRIRHGQLKHVQARKEGRTEWQDQR